MVGCKRQASVTTAPSSQPSGATTSPNVTGGATHRDALVRFLQAAKVQDVQAMANVWGASRGPARSFMSADELQMRVIYMMRCLRHDSHSTLSETPAVGDKRLFSVQLKYGPTTAVTDFTTTPGPEGRFYVENSNLEKTQAICSAK